MYVNIYNISLTLFPIRKLNREKSFDEARTAVQSQIEKIFQKAAAGKAGGGSGGGVAGDADHPHHLPLAAAGPRRYKMHGIRQDIYFY